MQSRPIEIRVDTTCPECNHTGRIPQDRLGYQVRCPRCEARFVATEAAPTLDITPAPISATRQRKSSQIKDAVRQMLLRLEDNRRLLNWTFLIVSFISWLIFDVASNNRFPAVPAAIICILVMCVGVTNLVPRVRDLSHWRRRSVAVMAAIFLLYCWSWFDLYTETIEGGLTTKYVDRYKFGNDPCHMVVVQHDPASFINGIPILNIAEISIPVTRDGVSHGEGEMVIYSPYREERIFYWYGEIVSEGEWHLRNR